MRQNKAAKRWFLLTALSFLGTPYRWGGDDPSGIDCSGLVVECLKSVGVLGEREDFSADGLLRRFCDCEVAAPRKAALLFYVRSSHRATHVAIGLDEHFQISAAGGRLSTIDAGKAWRDNAFVKIRPIRFDPAQHVVIDVFGEK